MSSTPRHLSGVLSKLLAPFAKRFIAGTTLAEALDKLSKLKIGGFGTTLDHLGESVANAAEAKHAADEYCVMLRALKEKNLDRNVSLKLTQMGLAISEDFCLENLSRIVKTAEDVGGFVRVDMEGSDVTQKTIDIVGKMKKTRATPIGCVLQAMLKRTPTDLVGMLENNITLRLCKGAYKEPGEIAYGDMRNIRHQYLALSKRLLTSGMYHGIATHDEWLVRQVMQFARGQKISPDKFEFQMLLGIRPKFQKWILSEGFRLRIYVPFGNAWLPYTWRRIRERKENLWFVVKSVFQR